MSAKSLVDIETGKGIRGSYYILSSKDGPEAVLSKDTFRKSKLVKLTRCKRMQSIQKYLKLNFYKVFYFNKDRFPLRKRLIGYIEEDDLGEKFPNSYVILHGAVPLNFFEKYKKPA